MISRALSVCNAVTGGEDRLNPVDLSLVLLLALADLVHLFNVLALADLCGLCSHLGHLEELPHVLVHGLELVPQTVDFPVLLREDNLALHQGMLLK